MSDSGRTIGEGTSPLPDTCPKCGYYPCRIEGDGRGNRICSRCGLRYYNTASGRSVLVEAKGPDDATMVLAGMTSETAERRNRYLRTIRGATDPTETLEVDVYSVCDAFGLDHKLAHVVKKLLSPGARGGGKSEMQDLEEAAWTLSRYIADRKALEPQKPQKPLEP